MIKFIKNLIWIVKHREEIEKLLGKTNEINKNYSLVGVPEYQMKYIQDVLDSDK